MSGDSKKYSVKAVVCWNVWVNIHFGRSSFYLLYKQFENNNLYIGFCSKKESGTKYELLYKTCHQIRFQSVWKVWSSNVIVHSFLPQLCWLYCVCLIHTPSQIPVWEFTWRVYLEGVHYLESLPWESLPWEIPHSEWYTGLGDSLLPAMAFSRHSAGANMFKIIWKTTTLCKLKPLTPPNLTWKLKKHFGRGDPFGKSCFSSSKSILWNVGPILKYSQHHEQYVEQQVQGMNSIHMSVSNIFMNKSNWINNYSAFVSWPLS